MGLDRFERANWRYALRSSPLLEQLQTINSLAKSLLLWTHRASARFCDLFFGRMQPPSVKLFNHLCGRLLCSRDWRRLNSSMAMNPFCMRPNALG
jgi:hypothetical protein